MDYAVARADDLPLFVTECDESQPCTHNPLGAKAIYLGSSLYRIHGTNDTGSIGTEASSGCIRMHNGHVVHLAKMVNVGTKVHVVN